MIIQNKEINHKLSHLTTQSGCYFLRNEAGTIIYVGKARNLQKRVSSYLQGSSPDYFRQQIFSFDTIVTNNVKEALILEQNLIKQHQPRFNILLKDSHYYPYIEITKEKNPRYKLVRRIDTRRKGEYFGPFPDGTKAREIFQILERIFPLAKCKGNLGKPCFYYTINQCSGHCFQVVETSYYEKIKAEVRKFFQGKTQELKKKIKNSIQKNIANLAFEIASKEKKILDNIDFFTSRQNIEFTDRQNCDFLGSYWQDDVIAFYLLIYRYGKLFTTEEAVFPVWTNETEILETYLYQFYQNNLSPQLLYLSKKWPKMEVLEAEFNFTQKVPQRGRKKEILNLANQNAQQAWQKNYWNEFQQVDKRKVLTEISNFLSIPLPNYIECLDISNLYKQDIVAGFLTFINGEKNFARSKLYKLTSTENESDIARIKKACLIHYQKFSHSALPNLIIVDGGKEQVKAVQQVLKELTLNASVIGLVKNENHATRNIITSNLKELSFGSQEKIRNFLTNCQAEVHRYAINFHRKLHRRSILSEKK